MERIPPCVTSQHGAVWYVTVCLGMHGHTSKLAVSRLANTKLHLQGKQLVLFEGGLHFMTIQNTHSSAPVNLSHVQQSLLVIDINNCTIKVYIFLKFWDSEKQFSVGCITVT